MSQLSSQQEWASRKKPPGQRPGSTTNTYPNISSLWSKENTTEELETDMTPFVVRKLSSVLP
eukprot:scaffold116324_cov13-Tisochrysis_lutea.AAC.2